jgi:CRP-like cAMP-binding protein
LTRPHEHLVRSPLFQDLAPHDLDAVLGAAGRRAVPRGNVLFRQGEPARFVYMLARGEVRLTQVRSDGREVALRYVGPGEIFGGIAAFGHADYPATAEAVDDGEALAWDGDALSRLMERYPRIALRALRLVIDRVHELQERVAELSTQRVEQRIARALLRLAHKAGRAIEGGVLIEMPLSLEDLAEFAGTTLYTVSRIYTRWEAQGVIVTGRERVLIRTPASLEAIAEDRPSPDGPSASREASARRKNE